MHSASPVGSCVTRVQGDAPAPRAEAQAVPEEGEDDAEANDAIEEELRAEQEDFARRVEAYLATGKDACRKGLLERLFAIGGQDATSRYERLLLVMAAKEMGIKVTDAIADQDLLYLAVARMLKGTVALAKPSRPAPGGVDQLGGESCDPAVQGDGVGPDAPLGQHQPFCRALTYEPRSRGSGLRTICDCGASIFGSHGPASCRMTPRVVDHQRRGGKATAASHARQLK